MTFLDAVSTLATGPLVLLFVALATAFAFEFINGFHDTANAVTTVIYSRSLPPLAAVVYSGFMNFLGVLLGGTAVAFSIVNLLPVDLLVDARSGAALAMVLSLLIAGVLWNLGTWYVGLPVSSSHTLIGSILGVGLANGLWTGQGLAGVKWDECLKVGLALLISPALGFVLAAGLLLLLKVTIRSERLYQPPPDHDRPPGWIRTLLIGTCGGVSFAHGSNDGQKGMGLLLLVLIGFLPLHYALTVTEPQRAVQVYEASRQLPHLFAAHGQSLPIELETAIAMLQRELEGKNSFDELPVDREVRWEVRQAIMSVARTLKQVAADPHTPQPLRHELDRLRRQQLLPAVEYVPVWVVIGTALALGIGTCIGYRRIVITVAEKIGKQHLAYAQGAAAESVAAITILIAALTGLPVSTTHVLSSGVAGTMIANGNGIQQATVTKILTAWLFTLPATMALAGLLFAIGRLISG
ncbi:MAG: inorganic phosphate transporter [Gemmataceae bacterium]|nr:inorganic phosphate transporter [Gemmataceae bacterium]